MTPTPPSKAAMQREADVEHLVQRYHDYAQTHLPSDSKRQLVQNILVYLKYEMQPLREAAERILNATGKRDPEAKLVYLIVNINEYEALRTALAGESVAPRNDKLREAATDLVEGASGPFDNGCATVRYLDVAALRTALEMEKV